MSLSITINNIDDLTDTERAVLRMIVGDKQVTLAGPTATKHYLESIARNKDDDNAGFIAGCGHLASEHGLLLCDECSKSLASAAASSTAMSSPVPAPTPVTLPSPPTPASAELDSAGLPWDKRIHSSSRAKVADGTWRKMRGVDDALVATVEAELRAVQALPTGAPAPAAPAPAAPAPAAPAPAAPAPTLAEMQAKLAAAENAAPPAPATAAPLTFAELMKHVTPMLVGNKLSQDKLLAICAEFGLPHLAALGARPDLVEAVKARIDAEVEVQHVPV